MKVNYCVHVSSLPLPQVLSLSVRFAVSIYACLYRPRSSGPGVSLRSVRSVIVLCSVAPTFSVSVLLAACRAILLAMVVIAVAMLLLNGLRRRLLFGLLADFAVLLGRTLAHVLDQRPFLLLLAEWARHLLAGLGTLQFFCGFLWQERWGVNCVCVILPPLNYHHNAFAMRNCE